MKSELPESDLAVESLSRLFNDTTTSYKYLFFQAILALLALPGNAGTRRSFTLRELVIEMLVIGWYPKHFFRLSFGVQDKLGRVTDALHHEHAAEQVGVGAR